MKRAGACLILLVGLALMSQGIAVSQEDNDSRVDLCAENRPYSPFEIESMIYCAVARWGGDGQKIENMGRCESGLNDENAGNPPYVGVFQYHPDTWESAATQLWHPNWGRRNVIVPSIRNGRAQVLVTVKYVRARGYGPWSAGICA